MALNVAGAIRDPRTRQEARRSADRELARALWKLDGRYGFTFHEELLFSGPWSPNNNPGEYTGDSPITGTSPAGVASSSVIVPRDPNELLGPAGFGPQNYVRPNAFLPYRINFENDPSAAAPAQRVEITNPLPAATDAEVFELTGVGFGDRFFVMPAGSRTWEHVEPVTSGGLDFEVQIQAGIRADGTVFATFQSIDPATSLPPPVEIGFLPPEPAYEKTAPNAAAPGRGRGRGFVSYTVRPTAGLANETEIRNVATIVFDGEAAITTNQVDPHDASKGTDPTREALVTILDSEPLAAPNMSLLGGAHGRSYGTWTLSTTGGFGAITWEVTGLPPGLVASSSGGTLTVAGTPTASGTYRVVFAVRDEAGSTVTWTQTIVVRPAAEASPPAGQVTREYRVKIPLEPSDLRARPWPVRIASRPAGVDSMTVDSQSPDLLTVSGSIVLSGGGTYRFTNQRLTRTHSAVGSRRGVQFDLSATSTTDPLRGVRVWGSLSDKRLLGSFAFQSRNSAATAFQTLSPWSSCEIDLSLADFLAIEGGISFVCDAGGAVHGVGSVRVPFGSRPRVPVTVSGQSGGTLRFEGRATWNSIDYDVRAETASWTASTSFGEPSVLFGRSGSPWSAQATAKRQETRLVGGSMATVAVEDPRVGAGTRLTLYSPRPRVALLCINGHDLTSAVSSGSLTPDVVSPSYLHRNCGPFLADALIAAGFPTETTYFSDDGATRSADDAGGLDALVRKLCDLRRWEGGSQPTRVVIVAHGHGGVWAHWALLHEVPDVTVHALIDLDTNSLLWGALHGTTDSGALRGVNPDRGEEADGRLRDIDDVVPSSVRNNLEVVPDRRTRLEDLFVTRDPFRLDGVADASVPLAGLDGLDLQQTLVDEAGEDRNVVKDIASSPLPRYTRRETADSHRGLHENTAEGGGLAVARDWLLPLIADPEAGPTEGTGVRWVVDAWDTVVRTLPSATSTWDGTDDVGSPVPAGIYFLVTPTTDSQGNVTLVRSPNPISRTPPMVSIASMPTATSRPQLAVQGAAASDVGVASVAWTTDRGHSGTAVGESSWAATVHLEDGANTLTFTATDAGGNTATAMVAVEYRAARLRLVPGFNLVGLSSVPGGSFRASTFLASINSGGGSVSAVVDANGAPSQTRLATGSGPDFAVVPGQACFVLSATTADVTVPGDLLPPTATVALRSGFNYVSLPVAAAVARKASAVAGDIASQGGRVTAIYQWRDGSPVPYLPGRALNDFEIAAGEGFIVLCESACVWEVRP